MKKLTDEYLRKIIAHVEYVTHTTPSGKILRWCVLTLDNGFCVTGKPSVCVDPKNDEQEIGEAVAFDNAFEELWQIEGYRLHLRLQQSTGYVFDEYLFNNSQNNNSRHLLTVKNDMSRITGIEKIEFYIHPDGVDGDTLDFVVEGNQLICTTQ